MIAGAMLVPDRPIDTSLSQTGCEHGAEQEMIKTEPGVPLPPVSHVVPECVDTFVAMQLTDGVSPTLIDEPRIGGTALRPHQCIVIP